MNTTPAPTPTTPKRSELWQRLRSARARAGLTQKDVAKAFGLNRSAVTLWEGAPKNDDGAYGTRPTSDKLTQLAALYKVDVAWLLDDNSDPEQVWEHAIIAPGAPVTTAKKVAEKAAGDAFFSAVRFAVQARMPPYSTCFDTVLLARPTGMLVRAPFIRGGVIVSPATLDGDPVEVIQREAAKLLLLERAHGRKSKLHLVLWASPDSVPKELLEGVKSDFLIDVLVTNSVDTAADFVLSL